MLIKVLGDAPSGQQPTVLDLRAAISRHLDIKPEVSQVNRVLFSLEAKGNVQRGAPVANRRTSQKPTWALSCATTVPSLSRDEG
jgi:hypothetical protein